jgi:hypothetical protein
VPPRSGWRGWHAARPLATQLAGSNVEAEREAGKRGLARLRPGPSAVQAFVAGLAFLAVVAAAGLWMR